ncbi:MULTISPECIES: [citrate (pro-3S)-lyase] ligase [unclassified Enterococcus]|uniref:[citrate (pro-3S)-lyase] ligase n=1 Tax=unclassified Enterococcus TaxID=2608891 RepID=UPI0013EE0998|nr:MULTISPECIES: [citrate (pro-3S)-lyase] ligase [unclassified Enterococcus]
MYRLKRLWLDQDTQTKKQWQKLMDTAGLDPDEEVGYTAGIYDKDRLVATGSFLGNILKGIAVCQKYQSENLLTRLMGHLLEKMREEGVHHQFVYTKPENELIFHSLGFQEILVTEELVFMEIGAPDFRQYRQMLEQAKKGEDGSAIVMNANPFTKGHQYLIEKAAEQSEHVYVFVLSEDRSAFSSAERLAMVKLGVAHLKNVSVLPTNDYLVSSAIFPAYFLKENAPHDVAHVQAKLDAQLFKEKLAPILAIRKRYVGEEPLSEVTAIYNQMMREVFHPEIELVVLPRLRAQGEIISATRVRKALEEKDWSILTAFLPETTLDYLEKHKKIER